MDPFHSLNFWTIVAGVVAFIIKLAVPSLPVTPEQVLFAILTLLGLINVVPTFTRYALGSAGIFGLKAFWVLIAALFGLVMRTYFPTWPFTDDVVLSFLIFVLGFLQIQPEIRARMAYKQAVRGK